MNEIYLIKEDRIVSEYEFRLNAPGGQVLPELLSAEVLKDFDAEPILPKPAPPTGSFQRAVRDGIERDAKGNLMYAWRVISWSQQEIDDYLKAARQAKWEDIKRERAYRKFSGVKVQGEWLHSDNDSRLQWLGLKDTGRDMLGAGGAMTDVIMMDGYQLQWYTMNGVWIPVTVQLAFDVVQAIKELDSAAHKAASLHDMKLMQSKDPANYSFSEGWPPIFTTDQE